MLPELIMSLTGFGVSFTYLLRYFTTKNGTHLTPVLAWMALGIAYGYYLFVPVDIGDRALTIRSIVFIIAFSEIARNVLLLRYGKQ
jgi:hypothetical protein